MLRCERCNNDWSRNIMYEDKQGRNVCIHCLGSDEEAIEAKTTEELRGELVTAISKAMEFIDMARTPSVKLAAGKPLNCVENYEIIRSASDLYLNCAEYELKRGLNG